MLKPLKCLRVCIALFIVLCFTSHATLLLAAEPVVFAVLFYSPTCAHCHYVVTEVITPLVQQYGDQCQIIGVNVADPGGQALYQAAITYFAIPPERQGVPTLVIGETVLVGSVEIPEQLPGLVESYLAQDGVDWPAIPGLSEALSASDPTSQTPSPVPTTATVPATALAPTATPVPSMIDGVEDSAGWRDRFAIDPLGNGISLLVLLGMIVSVLYNGLLLIQRPSGAVQARGQWAIFPLVALGLIVAGYLAYVETQQVTAVCGPVGDCNAVQQSDYALLFGFLPIAVLGLLGYVAIGVAWTVVRYGRGLWGDIARIALVGMVWFGVFFSIYLTFLEPFVIGATCAWCLTSAVVMTLLFWIVAPLTRPALAGGRAHLRTRLRPRLRA